MNIVIRKHHFKVNPGQNKEAWDYINTGLWEPYTFDILDYFVKPNTTIMDIGAWSGVLSLYIAHKAQKVFSLDPDPVCFQELQTNIKLNPILAEKIFPYQTAISGKKETIQLSARKTYGASSSSILSRKKDTENSLKITAISLFDFIIQEKIKQVDFIKMDVEGAEFKILPHIGLTIKELKYPTLYISFHYNFLNEHIYNKSIHSKFLNKVLLKLEKVIGFSFFKKKIKAAIQHLHDDLMIYEYIYTAKGDLVDKKILIENPEFIKNHDLVFTNIKWK
ncbi:FkbM family methyltransferase [Aquimarina sp. 2201CG14-23]|uniref:FkbM family methyltransferase n=1 Tax=Aquimarina mycalae TaxID=3040073 RepID=UPI00247819E3|nr:FkbM family methyltransferase [Aquimarina sp. 2201CG14-23]MDH7448048.1 FkbM family methyltransferase [Aquimarina sp. 2201CG14-23]